MPYRHFGMEIFLFWMQMGRSDIIINSDLDRTIPDKFNSNDFKKFLIISIADILDQGWSCRIYSKGTTLSKIKWFLEKI